MREVYRKGKYLGRYPPELMRPVFRGALEHLNARLKGGLHGKRIFDAGCGAGVFLQEAINRGAEVSGADSSGYAVRSARRVTERVYRLDLSADEIPESGLDIVTCYHTMEHLADPRFFLRSAYGALKSGGVLHLLLPSKHADPGFDRTHVNRYNVRRLKVELMAAGFQRIEVERRPKVKKIVALATYQLRALLPRIPRLPIPKHLKEPSTTEPRAQTLKDKMLGALFDPKGVIEVFAYK